MKSALVVAAAVLLTSCSAPEYRPSTGVRPSAGPVSPDPRVGAVFVDGSKLHTCTGSVLRSPAGDLILTAAHCLSDDDDAVFVPGYGAGPTARDGWQIDAVFFDTRWLDGRDPAADYAVARVSRDDGVSLASVAGDGLDVGAAPGPGKEVTVIGYPSGAGGPQVCRAPAAPERQGFPTLHCDGVVNGFSGAPWISGGTVTGLIGGLDGGGCADEVSFSPPFDQRLAELVARAQAGGPGDEVSAPFDDGCP